MTLILVLVIIGGVLGAVDLVQSRGRGFTSWGVVALAVALIVSGVR